VRGLLLAGPSLLVLVLLISCSKPPAPKLEKLQFPVVVLFENSSVRVCSGADELTKMHTNNLTLNNEPPHLIDSKFNIFRMENLRSVHGGLWSMANPVAITEVTFGLKRLKSGRAEAVRLCAAQLRKQTWRDDQASRLEALDRSQSLLEMEQAISPNDN
jgi:hypothetical protein